MSSRRKITQTVLENGMPAVHIHCPGSPVGYFGVVVKAGSRNETTEEYGLAHFVEHTIFKGTVRRRSSHIINRMESVGGELNAYTTKEETVIYSVFPNGNLARATELIADLTSNSLFPDGELDKERDVIADEIDSYLDSPADAVYDDFEDLIFAESPLGHNILGTKDTLERFDSLSCRRFVSRYYHPDNMVAFYSGSQGAGSVFATLDRYLSPAIGREATDSFMREVPAVRPVFDSYRTIPSHQTHCVVGSRIPGLLDDARYPAVFLANLLGGPGMNSLLNVELRERRGLVYSVDATTSLFSDCGLLTIYFGSDPDDSGLCRELIDKTVSRLVSSLTPTKLTAAKKQYLGQLVVAADNRENSALSAARSILWRGDIIDADETADAIRRLSVGDIVSAAENLLPLSALVFSPLER